MDLQSHDVYKQAVALKIRMEEEEAVRELLRSAIKAASLEQLDAALDKMVKMGLNEEPLYREGLDLKDFLNKQVRVCLCGVPDAGCERLPHGAVAWVRLGDRWRRARRWRKQLPPAPWTSWSPRWAWPRVHSCPRPRPSCWTR